MKSLTALNILKRAGWCHPNMRLSDLRGLRRLVSPGSTWDEYVAEIAMGRYLLNEPLPPNGVSIPEVWLRGEGGRWRHGLHVGGTMDLRTGRLIEKPARDGGR